MADDIKIVGLSSKKSGGTNWKVISAIIGIIVLSVGVIAGILLVRQNQNIEEKALECSLGGAACPDPSNPSLLRDCSTTGETFPNDSLCNSAGRVEVCGTSSSNARQYCCPSAGAAWTTNLSLCNVAPTATGTARATATATATATSTATATAKATTTATGSGSKTASPTATSKSTTTAKATSTTKATSTAKATGSGTAFPVPETGADFPTVIGFGFGIVMVLISLALAL